MIRLTGIGEAMGELRSTIDGLLSLEFSGDVLNTLAYLRMMGDDAWDVSLVTATGDDPVTAGLANRCRDLGVSSDFSVVPGSTLGLYMIHTNPDGERHFSYWRSASPARQTISRLTEAQCDRLRKSELIYFSGITLAILDDAQREVLLGITEHARLVFDPNYRATLWESVGSARHWISLAYAASDIVFPGIEDETQLFGVTEPQAVLDRPELAGASEVVVKAGRKGAFARLGKETVFASFVEPEQIVDTTAAGDAFNAGWLAARQAGLPAQHALAFSVDAATAVASQSGAIIGPSMLPKLTDRSPAT